MYVGQMQNLPQVYIPGTQLGSVPAPPVNTDINSYQAGPSGSLNALEMAADLMASRKRRGYNTYSQSTPANKDSMRKLAGTKRDRSISKMSVSELEPPHKK